MKLLTCFFCLIFLIHLSQAQTLDKDTLTKNETIKSFQSIIQTLAHDSMGGRYAGSPYEDKARHFIIHYYLGSFLKDDYIISTDTFTYCCRNNDSITAHNIFAIPKQGNKKHFILAAHYDHLPPGSSFSKEIWNKNYIHPGADDNASGVALALLVFKNWYLHKNNSNFNIILILFSGHEEGLFGSKYWTENHSAFSHSVILMLNFDMIGHMSEETCILSARTENNNVQDTILTNLAKQTGIRLVLSTDNIQNTDARSFLSFGYPVFSFTTGIHNDYHRITDTPEKINYSGLLRIYNFINNVLKIYF
ncbi:MAG: alkaline phosphatase isozyme conversion aminopeptidase [Bacteroidetes bacterium ADurb.Bin408]|nr:MAG: alkaline phosphatase isozyme conversion aminopeptidase [Bacteroidetes bacterium ADurb.Bin408]